MRNNQTHASKILVAVCLALAAPLAAQQADVPRSVDGHPDLSGTWDNGAGIDFVRPTKDGESVCIFGCAGGAPPPPAAGPAPRQTTPQYKPELAARVADLDQRQVQEDPVLRCMAPGVPRIGPPDKIVQRAGEAVFLYEDVSGSFFRIVPTDGRPHPTSNEPSFLGDAVGHWEGDTLVVETKNFNDLTWLTDNGAFHRAHGAVGGREARGAAHGSRDRRVAAVYRPLARAHGRRLAPHEPALSVRSSAARDTRSQRCRR
jgi:hypothetical protein